MSQYYLISQLPALEPYDGKSPLPITEEEFHETCSRFLSKGQMKILDGVSLIPPRDPKPSGSAFVDAWNREERLLRLALGSVRAAQMKKSFSTDDAIFPVQTLQAASAAVEQSDPLVAEEYLNRCRIETLERVRPTDSFSEDAVYYYALRLKLLERIRLFDAERGRRSYQNIYRSILNGDDQEK